jgi:hypothetical protein
MDTKVLSDHNYDQVQENISTMKKRINKDKQNQLFRVQGQRAPSKKSNLDYSTIALSNQMKISP